MRNPQSLTEAVADEKAEIITDYVRAFATIDGRAVTPELYTIYIKALSHFETRKLEKGLRRALESEVERWPWPATLAEIIDDEV